MTRVARAYKSRNSFWPLRAPPPWRATASSRGCDTVTWDLSRQAWHCHSGMGMGDTVARGLDCQAWQCHPGPRERRDTVAGDFLGRPLWARFGRPRLHSSRPGLNTSLPSPLRTVTTNRPKQEPIPSKPLHFFVFLHLTWFRGQKWAFRAWDDYLVA